MTTEPTTERPPQTPAETVEPTAATADPALPTSVPVGVVGAGTMGAGIAQVAVLAGHPVRLYDVADGAAEAGVASIGARIDRLVAKGACPAADAAAAKDRLTLGAAIADLSDCGLVVEAAAEDLAVKRAVFADLEAACADDAILATNTSTLSVTAIAAGLRRPGRVCGMHFFNPAPLMRLVEVPAGDRTEPAVVDAVTATAAAWGKTPVRCASTPGFIVNRVARPFYGEPARLLEARAADCATIDAVLREAGGFPMGAFELADLVGNDINLAVARSVWEQTSHDPRYAPTVAQQQLVEAGRFGRKTGHGWFRYAADSPARLDAEPATAERRPAPEQVTYHGGFTAGYGLIDRIAAAGVSVERYRTGPTPVPLPGAVGSLPYGIELPGGGYLLESTGEPATLDADVVTVDWVHDPAAATRICLAPSDRCEPETLDEAIGLFQAAGLAVSVVDDAPGLIVARTVAMLINEAVELVARGEATAADVEAAMVAGTGYPEGLLSWGDRLGAGLVADVLGALSAAYPSGRYRPAPLLVRAAHSGRPLTSL